MKFVVKLEVLFVLLYFVNALVTIMNKSDEAGGSLF